MKDLDLIKQLGDELAPPAGESPTALPAVAFRESPRRWPFKTWQAGVVTLAVVGATAAVVGSSWSRSDTPLAHAPTPRAATVLDKAAAVSQESPISPFPNSAYIFTETVSSYPEQVQQPDGSFTIMRQAPVVTQVWLPVDPTKRGKQRQRPAAGNVEWGPWVTVEPCQAQTASTTLDLPQCTRGVLPADFPTEPSAVLAWLKGNNQAGAPSPQSPSSGPIEGQDALALERAKTLLVTGTYLLPDHRSAIFKALAQLPEVVTVADAHDGAGRPGIGISAGGFEALVFDSASFAFFGTTSSAVMRQGATTEAGKVP
ncbi:hypothetical protein GA0070216_114120 [Micromonospora matsumotoense]|uniref:Uncharacterized protein n=1 Tax=Micromonospora matsumotoense TaxID=121616 RepID=A0A1C5A7S0_9ACTN|nr:CU044_5270 family protein [Micromonospora matsumotoense]SCF41260.1 hypothetical protein GA0070216_114120 [Micromonospora matsumotoense]